MKKTVLACSLLLAQYLVAAQVKMPAPSTTQYVKQDFGTATIELTYSRPNLKGRTIIGKQDAYGEVWRTGANAATKLKFNEVVSIGGKLIDTGTYVLYTIPKKGNEWTVIINKGVTNWGADGYKESEDVVRFTAPYSSNKKAFTESFTINFDKVLAESLEVVLQWDNWQVRFPITVNIKDKLRSQIEAALQGEKKPYQTAANFYYEWDKDYAKALTNVDKAIDANKKAFWLYLLKAKIQKELGNNTASKEAAQTCITIATEAKNAAYVSQANDLIKSLK